MYEELTEKKLDSTILHKGKFFDLYIDKVRLPDGRESTREYITHPGAAVILPLFKNGDIILIRQYRYPLQTVFLELPAGKLDENEAAEICAERELLEETGYHAKELNLLTKFYPCIGYSDEEMWLYLATDLHEMSQNTDHDEFIQAERVPYIEALELVKKGQITDLKSMVSLYHAKDFVESYLKGS